MTSESVPRLRPLAGITTTRELQARGNSARQIVARVAAGQLVRIGFGYYATSDFADRLQALPFGAHFLRTYAAVGRLGPGAVASHRSAAHIHEIEMLAEPGATVTVTRPPGRGSRTAGPGVHLHVARLPETHISQKFGVPLTTAARTVLDLARSLPFREGVVVADSALRQRRTSKEELRAVLAECPRARGCQQAATVVEFADGLSESPLESIARVVFRECNLPPPALQVRIQGSESEFLGRVDFLWKQHRTIAEVDGLMKYTDPYRARDQLRRDQRLRAAGYEVVHFEWRDITSEPSAVGTAIRTAFRASAQRWRAGSVA